MLVLGVILHIANTTSLGTFDNESYIHSESDNYFYDNEEIGDFESIEEHIEITDKIKTVDKK